MKNPANKGSGDFEDLGKRSRNFLNNTPSEKCDFGPSINGIGPTPLYFICIEGCQANSSFPLNQNRTFLVHEIPALFSGVPEIVGPLIRKAPY